MKSIWLPVIMLVTGALLAIPMKGSAEWWDKFSEPKYGGTITVRDSSPQVDLDPYNSYGGLYMNCGDFLWNPDWKLDRKTWAFQTQFIPNEYWAGSLAESWEQKDPYTIVVHIRKGVRWQKKPPVNGREFTAEDVQYHYDRVLGTGSGFAKPDPFWAGRTGLLKKVAATDKFTVEFRFKSPSYQAFLSIVDLKGLNFVEAREWVELGEKGRADWKNLVGTGPWMLADLVIGSSVTYTKNPDYWGHDERWPKNKLPYADNLKTLIIPDMSTAIAALRTGKVDMLGRLPWQQARTIAKNSPKLVQAGMPTAGQGITLVVNRKPFTDIRVRKALQMAIDRKAIAKSLFGGSVEGIPCGVVSPTFKEYTAAYEYWPAELREEYSYNPGKAKKLLAQAGYPGGFKTNVVMMSILDKELAQTIKAYFKDIGVDMEIRLMDPPVAMQFAFARKQDQMWWNANSCGRTFMVYDSLVSYKANEIANYGSVKDPAFDALYDKYMAASNAKESIRLTKELDMYTIKNHWSIVTFPTSEYYIWQPYIGGYSGELPSGGSVGGGAFWARLWTGNK